MATKVTPAPAVVQRRMTPLLAMFILATMTMLLLVGALLSARSLAARSSTPPVFMVPVGIAAQVPRGSVTVLEVEHIESSGPGSSDSHLMEVLVRVEPEPGASARELTGGMLLQGGGIEGTLTPREGPLESLVGDTDADADISLTYVVPDDSTRLGIGLPGGVILSARHPDHPGDE